MIGFDYVKARDIGDAVTQIARQPDARFIAAIKLSIESEEDMVHEIARIANLSIKKGYQIQDEKRLLTKEEAYEQISYSASLFRAILKYVEKID